MCNFFVNKFYSKNTFLIPPTGKLKQIKILDPACGSGAFPMGLLNRMVDMLQKIEPEQSVYDLKLSIIENCIYGSDIQTIATQISKLRFFISLICDCEKDESKPNYGIPTLPNLETKFVTANSLIPRKNKGIEVQGNLFVDSEIKEIKEQLFDIRHKHFRAKTASEKIRLRKADEQLRANLAELLSQGFQSDLGADQLSRWNPYDQNAVADFFDAEWMFGLAEGFDIVIGNPPYIQLQKSTGQKGKDKKGKEFDMKFADLYVDCNFETFDRTGDIYCLFYERGHQLLRQGGHLCYITSNKWMRAGYGESTRQFFVSKTDPQLLIDFAGVKIFESATVDTNILLFEKAENKGRTICSVTKDKDKDHINKLSDFVRRHHTVSSFATADSWVILSEIEQSIKNKIEAIGKPLKDWDIQINYGIKTGYNEAFIISSEKREELLACCEDQSERSRTAEMIRPILRGKDIKRYGYKWAGLWLINTHNGVRGKYNPIDINDYPTIKHHLDKYWDKISTRDDKGVTPYNLRNCAYMDDFFKPKIVYGQFQDGAEYAFAEEGVFLSSNEYMLITHNYSSKTLLAFLNCKTSEWLLGNITGNLGGNAKIGQKSNFLKLSIAQLSVEQQKEFDKLVDEILQKKKQHLDTEALEKKIDEKIYKVYNFTEQEIKEIERC